MALVVDGKKLAQEILEEVRSEISAIKKKVRLASVLVGSNSASISFLKEKERACELAGIDFRLYRFPENITTSQLRARLAEIVHLPQNTGVILQLPLAEHLNTQYLLNAITPQKDVDCLSEGSLGAFIVGRHKILPPPVAALKFICEKFGITTIGKLTVVIGAGRLVGKPIAAWLMQQETNVVSLNEHTKNIGEFTRRADIIVSGVGQPHIIRPDMVREGVVVFDFGFSKQDEKIVGDVEFDEVSEKASLITPVPGGLGPLTVTFLVKNLLTLASTPKR